MSEMTYEDAKKWAGIVHLGGTSAKTMHDAARVLAKRCEELGDVLQSIASNSLEFESDGSVWYTHYDKDGREAGHEAVDASQYLSFVVAKARAAIAAQPKEQADA